MPNDYAIDYVEFPASDLAAVKAFYERAFGWSFTDYGPDYTAFTSGSIAGGFFTAGASSKSGQGAALVVLYAQDLEATLRRVEESGGTIVKPIFSFPGGRRFHFEDPNGNELGVWSDRP